MGEVKLQAQIEILASLQTIDREIKEHTGKKQGLLSELETKEKEIRAKKGEIDVLGTSFSEKEKLRSEKDRLFQDEGKKAMDKRMRMNRIKNAKELQALQREIDQMRQGNGELEEEDQRFTKTRDHDAPTPGRAAGDQWASVANFPFPISNCRRLAPVRRPRLRIRG